MTNFEADPVSIRGAAASVGEIAARTDGLALLAQRLAEVPMRQHFPALAEGQKGAQTWDEARETFAKGLTQVTTAISRLQGGLETAATNYERADDAGTQRFTGIDLPI